MLLQAAHFYDISLLALKWLTEARDKDRSPRPRSLSPILYALVEAELITHKQRIAAIKDPKLRMKLRNKLVLCQTTADHTRQQALVKQLQTGTQHLIVGLPPNARFDSSRLLGKHAYRFHLAQGGMAYAESKEEPYRSIITSEALVEAWQETRRKAAVIAAAKADGIPKAKLLTGKFAHIDLDLEEFEDDVVA